MEREKIVNEIKEKLDGINGSFEPTEPTFVLETTGKAYRVLSVFLNEDHYVEFLLENTNDTVFGRHMCGSNWIAEESLLKIGKMLPTKWAVVRFHTPYGGCDLDWFVSREAIPADGDELGALYAYLIDYYSALVWTEVDDEFRAYPEEEEDCGAYFIATVED